MLVYNGRAAAVGERERERRREREDLRRFRRRGEEFCLLFFRQELDNRLNALSNS